VKGEWFSVEFEWWKKGNLIVRPSPSREFSVVAVDRRRSISPPGSTGFANLSKNETDPLKVRQEAKQSYQTAITLITVTDFVVK
jgi:hypothetical protein